jgi:predicted deacylase
LRDVSLTGEPPAPSPPASPPIEVAFPDLSRFASGNSGIHHVWTFAASRPGPHVLLQALTHGNEVCGAIALDRLLREGIQPTRVC